MVWLSRFTRGMGRKSGLPPGSLLHIGDTYADTVKISVLEYSAEYIKETDINSVEELLAFRNSSNITWISVIGLHDTEIIEKIGGCFDIHPLVLEDILDTNHRPKLEDYGEYLYLVLKSFGIGGKTDDLVVEQLSIVIGTNYVLSFQERGHDLFTPVRQRIESSKGRIRKSGADYLAYSLLDTIVDQYFSALEELGEKIEDMEEVLVLQPGRNALQEVHGIKRKMLHFRKAVWPLREVVGSLSRGESPLIQETTLLYLRDVYDHTIQVIETLETYRDIVSGMLDIYLSSVSNRMNQIMKVLTVISTIFIPLTFIVGWYGMNFKYMPELQSEYGYPAVIILMLSISLGMIRYFRTRDWL